jgi:alpha-L-fucosidase
MARGPFTPDWDSLAAYRTPDWFRNAKFGIWAHWGPQCEPEFGDWYARGMYEEGSDAYKYHLKKYGHPSQFGFKDIIHQWKAERWDPDALVSLYKQAGARYFVALANHHDNFDLYASKYQPQWNSTRLGPKKDLIAGWGAAARRHGLRFGVSVHAAHAWTCTKLRRAPIKPAHMPASPTTANWLKRTARASGGRDWTRKPCTRRTML